MIAMTPGMSYGLTAEWTNPDGGQWRDASNWSTPDYPDSSSYDVVLGSMGQPYEVLIDWYQNTFDIRHLEVSDPDATLRLDTVLNTFVATGGITNHGVIEMTLGFHIDIGSNTATEGSFLLGSGHVRFLAARNSTGTSYGQYLSFRSEENAATPHIIGPDMTIEASEGYGTISSNYGTTLRNEGLLWAHGNKLTVSRNLTNHGSLRADEGGLLQAVFTDGGLAGALELAAGGTISLGGTFAFDQSVTVPDGTRLIIGGIGSIADDQSITVDGGRLDVHTDQPVLGSTHFNGGTLGIGFDSDWAALQSRIPTGVARVVIADSGRDWSYTLDSGIDLVNENIDLAGLPLEFELESGLIRNGSISSSSPSTGPLNVYRGRLLDTEVTTDVDIENNLIIENSSLMAASILGEGTLNFRGNVLLNQVMLGTDWDYNSLSEGMIEITNGLVVGGVGAIAPNSPMVFAGAQRLDGAGTIKIYASPPPGELSNLPRGPGVMRVTAGELVIANGVSIDMGYDGAAIDATGESLVFEGDLITDASMNQLPRPGTSYVAAHSLTHHGLIRVDQMVLDVTADKWTLTDTATLEADLDTTWPTLIDVSGVAELNGGLILTIDPDWTPQTGESITLISAIGGITGRFTTVDQPSELALSYSPTSIMVTVQLPGDLNGDGFIGITDLNLILTYWNHAVMPGEWSSGDVSGDGFVGIQDLTTLLVNWNTGTPPADAAQNVPEPGGVGLLIMATGVLYYRHRAISSVG